jgi:hypothetical protein
MQAARQSIHQYENELESKNSSYRKGGKVTKGGPVLQDQANRYKDRGSYNQSEDSL